MTADSSTAAASLISARCVETPRDSTGAEAFQFLPVGEPEVQAHGVAPISTIRRVVRHGYEQAYTSISSYIFFLHVLRADSSTATDGWLIRALQPGAAHVWAAESSSFGLRHSAWRITRAVDEAMASAASERFEDGMETTFSRTIQALVSASPEPVLERFLSLVRRPERPSVLSEALRWVGELHDLASHDQRRIFLEAALLSSAPEVRDSAALGLSFLGDPAALPALRNAVVRERLTEIRNGILMVVRDLEVEQADLL